MLGINRRTFLLNMATSNNKSNKSIGLKRKAITDEWENYYNFTIYWWKKHIINDIQ